MLLPMKTTHEQLRLATTNEQPVNDLAAHQLRKAVGDQHEQRVREWLTERGWEVNDWGQGILGPVALDALWVHRGGMCWTPDFVVARSGKLAKVDAKGSMTSTFRDSHFVEYDAVDAHMREFVDYKVPIFYVFDDMSVLTPMEVIQRGRVRRGSLRGSGKPCYSIPVAAARPLDDVFGAPEQRATLAAAA